MSERTRLGSFLLAYALSDYYHDVSIESRVTIIRHKLTSQHGGALNMAAPSPSSLQRAEYRLGPLENFVVAPPVGWGCIGNNHFSFNGICD